MPTHSIGDHVMALDGGHAGRIVEIDGRIAYVLQDNGVELEFPLDRLRPFEAAKPAEQRTLSGPLRDTVLPPDQRRLLAAIPAELLAAVARSYEAGADAPGARPSFAVLPESKRLEVVRIHLPALPPRLLAGHMRLVVALRDLPRGR